MLRTKLNLLKKRKNIWFRHIVRYRSPTVAFFTAVRRQTEREGGGGMWRGSRKRWRREEFRKVCEGESYRDGCRELTVPAKAKQFGRDRECNQSQMVLLILHRCTVQTVTWHLEELHEMRIDWDLLQILTRFTKPLRSSTALELIVLA